MFSSMQVLMLFNLRNTTILRIESNIFQAENNRDIRRAMCFLMKVIVVGV